MLTYYIIAQCFIQCLGISSSNCPPHTPKALYTLYFPIYYKLNTTVHLKVLTVCEHDTIWYQINAILNLLWCCGMDRTMYTVMHNIMKFSLLEFQFGSCAKQHKWFLRFASQIFQLDWNLDPSFNLFLTNSWQQCTTSLVLYYYV